MTYPNQRARSLRHLGLGAILVLAMGAAGCASTPPSKQLLNARQAYNVAANSAAAQTEPDHLLSAKQALKKAEQAHENEPQSIEERHLAYVAHRMAQLAMAKSDVTMARHQKQQAEDRYVNVLAAQKEQTKQELEQHQRVLHEREKELAGEREARKGAQKSAQHARSEADEAEQARLEAEKKLQEAQSRLEDAMLELDRVSSVKVDNRGVVITINGSVLFEFGKAKLMSIAEDRLSDVAAALKKELDEGAKKKIVVEGHTDAIGTDEYNQKLSLERAKSVRQYLVNEGLDSSRIEAVGRGEQSPVASNDTPEGRANNRRVEIVVQDQQGQQGLQAN